MSFQPVQSDPEYHTSLQRRQSFLWLVLLTVVLFIAGVVFFIAYQFISSENGGSGSVVSPAPVMPAGTAVSSTVRGGVVSRGDHFLMSEVSLTDKRFRIFKIYHEPFLKEEIFALPWRDTAKAPVVAKYQENLAVFLDSGQSILLTPEGRTVSLSNSLFVPEDPHFSISPDGKKMVYFKQLSSLGTKSLTVRDLEKNEDVFGWPINSPASEVCDFNGWSADGEKTYCTSIKNGRVMVRAFDVRRYSHATVASFSGVRDARFYPEHGLLVVADKQSIFTFNSITKEKREVLALADEPAESVFLTPDKEKIVFSADDEVFVVGLDGGGKKEIDHANRILSLLPDGTRALVKVIEDDGAHYAIIGIDEHSHRELSGITKDTVHAQFIGWFSGGTK